MSVMKALLNEKSNQSVEEFKQNVITEGVRIFESGVDSPFKMSSLKEDNQLQSLFESTNEKDQKRAERCTERAEIYGEASSDEDDPARRSANLQACRIIAGHGR
jgi:hypothetical protein